MSDLRHELTAIVDLTMPQTRIGRTITWLIVTASFLRGFACGFAVSLLAQFSAAVGRAAPAQGRRGKS